MYGSEGIGKTERTFYSYIVLIVGTGSIFFVVNVTYEFELEVSTRK
jgi:hypothetical protein